MSVPKFRSTSTQALEVLLSEITFVLKVGVVFKVATEGENLHVYSVVASHECRGNQFPGCVLFLNAKEGRELTMGVD